MGTRAPSQSDADWNSWRRWFITVKSLVLLPHESAHANQVSACSSRRWSATLAELVHGSARRLTWQNRSTNLLRHGALSFNDWEVSRSKTIWSTHRPAMRTASNTPATIHQEEICLALNFVGKEERPRAQKRGTPGGVEAIPSVKPCLSCRGRGRPHSEKFHRSLRTTSTVAVQRAQRGEAATERSAPVLGRRNVGRLAVWEQSRA